VPTTDYDFASANARFNKQDLAKEAIASGSPDVAFPPAPAEAATNGHAARTNGTPEPAAAAAAEVVIPAASYDKGSSFFDNISSELKDREEALGRRLGGQEFRTEERKRNLETFGQGSVDNYRGGYRGRGRGRGFGRGRGGGFRGRGGSGVPRGRGQAQVADDA
jgi:protein LSM14